MYLIMAVNLKVFFGLKGIFAVIVWSSFNPIRDIGQDLLRTQHSIRIQSGISCTVSSVRNRTISPANLPVRTCDTWKKISPRLQNEGNFDSFFKRYLVLVTISTLTKLRVVYSSHSK